MCKKDSQLKQLFALLRSARVKAASKHVDWNWPLVVAINDSTPAYDLKNALGVDPTKLKQSRKIHLANIISGQIHEIVESPPPVGTRLV